MPQAQGSTTDFRYKKESTSNTEESGAGGTILRRVTGQLNLAKPEVLSQEKRDDFQELEQNHGTRSVNWNLATELFAGDYEEFLAAGLRRDFDAVTTISASSGDGFSVSGGTITRQAGGSESFITDGLRQGMIFRFDAMTESGINQRNMRITSAVTATTFDAVAVDGGAALADSADAEGASIQIPGKKTFIPLTGHTEDTFTIERHDSAIDSSDIGRGCKVGTIDWGYQPDQPPSLAFGGIGIDRRTVTGASAPSLTSPTAAGTGLLCSSGIGVARLNGSVVAVITGFNLNLNNGLSNRAVAFANTSPDIYFGRAAQVTGTINALVEGATLSDLFDDETELALEFFVEAPGSNPKTFFSMFMPRVKLNSADVDDPDTAKVMTMNFRALRPRSGTGLELSSLFIQDSAIT